MDNVREINTEGIFSRSDKGGVHRKWVHTGYRVLMYNFNGKLEEEFEDVEDAVRRNEVGATYVGIVNCVRGKVKKHAGKIWRRGENHEQ